VQRAADRDLFPMANHFGLGTMLYSPLAGGLLTAKYRKGSVGRLKLSATEGYQEDAAAKTIIDELELIAAEVEATPGQVALAWTLTKNAFSIVGARKLEHLDESFKALAIDLNAGQLARLEDVSATTMGYPHDLLKTVQKAY
jgi:aryl-alcohol dehydrogenase-like predicted oxidoreductase